MTKIEKFEDLTAWQKSRDLTRDIYEVTRQEAFARDCALREQMQGIAVSIMSCIAAGFESGGKGEYQHYLSDAKALCADIRSLLYVAKDLGYLDEDTFNKLMKQSSEVARILGGLRPSVQRIRNTKPE